MKPRRFVAPSSRDALRAVRAELGPDAVILSNRSIAEGVEIYALEERHVAALAEPAPPAAEKTRTAPAAAAVQPRAVQPARAAEPPAGAIGEGLAGKLMGEIKSLRGMLQEQLEGLAWQEERRREPAKVRMLRELLCAGFSPALTRHVIDGMSAELDETGGRAWLRGVLERNLPCIDASGDIVARGGVYAIVGPTGVGKTTTTAKIAARCVVRHGAGSLALLTTDGYRIGAQEQLRIYGRILGAPVYTVGEAGDLKRMLDELRGRHLVLIDTVGMSQRDRMVAEHLSMLSGCDVKRLLLLNATASGETLDDVVRAYQGDGLEGAVLTKVDETASLGSALDVVTRAKLPLHYVANGQRVPEDLHPADAHYLVDRAFRGARRGSAFGVDEALFFDALAVQRNGMERQANVA